MKRPIAIILSLCMLLSLSACAGLDALRNTELPPPPTPEIEAEETPAPSAAELPAPSPEETPAPSALSEGADEGDQIFIYLNQTKETEYAPDTDDLPILVFSYVTPKVRIDSNPAAANTINEQLRLLDELYYSGSESDSGKNRLYELALDQYGYATAKGDGKLELFSSIRSVHVFRADGSAISFLYWTSVYTGGAQSKHSYVGRSFNSQTGEALSLDQLSSDPEAMIKTLGDALLALSHDEPGLYESFTVDDVDAAIRALVRDGNWYFSSEGMVFFPDFGELRPEEQGIPMLTVPYAELAGVIDDKYLGALRESGGEMKVLRVSDVPEGTLVSIDRLVVSDGEELYLKTEGTLYDVLISSVAYYDQQDGQRFYETERYWYASFMTDCALQLSVALPEGMPNLMISYTDENHVSHRLLLSENGVDGTPVLVDDTIVAVG